MLIPRRGYLEASQVSVSIPQWASFIVDTSGIVVIKCVQRLYTILIS